MRSLRTLSLFMEGISLLLIFMLIMLLFSVISKQVVLQAALSMDESVSNLDASIEVYLNDRENAFAQLSTSLGDLSAQIVMPTFSDLYLTDENYVITQILQHEEDSLIFPGFDQSFSSIGDFLQEHPISNLTISPLMESPEFNFPSIYFIKRQGSGYLFGRLSLEDLAGLFSLTAQNLDGILIIASHEGYILSSTSVDLPFHVLPDQDVNEYGGYYIARRVSKSLGTELILLKPTDQIYRVALAIRAYFPFFTILLVVILSTKMIVHDRFMIRPINHFVDLIASWTIQNPPKPPTGLLMSTREFNLLFEHFSDKTISVSKAFNELDAARKKALDAEHSLKASEQELQTMNEELEERIMLRSQELELAYEQLMQQEKMASIGTLVAGVSHEINTPIGICVTTTSYLKDYFDQVSTKYDDGSLKRADFIQFQNEMKESLRILSSSLDRASELIVSFKKVAVGQSVESMSTFNLKEQLHLLIISLRHEYKSRRHFFTVDCPEDLTLTSYLGVYIQIFTNLIMNALIHGLFDQDEGEIRIQVKTDNGNLYIDFSDNGKGVPEKELRRIFEPFYTTNRAGGGSGLGLYIVYNLVTQKLGGSIKCESNYGQGTVFHMIVPIKPAGAEN